MYKYDYFLWIKDATLGKSLKNNNANNEDPPINIMIFQRADYTMKQSL